MRAITFIHFICPVLANFIQRVDLSDHRGAIGKEIKQKNAFSFSCGIYALCANRVFAIVIYGKTPFQNGWCFGKHYVMNVKLTRQKSALCKCYYGIIFVLSLCVLPHLFCIKCQNIVFF